MINEMYIHMVVSRIDPQRIGQAVSDIECQSRLVGCPAIRGLRQCQWIESLDDPGGMIWLTTWDSLENCQSFLVGQTYSRWMAALETYLQVEPHWYRYRLLADLVQDRPG